VLQAAAAPEYDENDTLSEGRDEVVRAPIQRLQVHQAT